MQHYSPAYRQPIQSQQTAINQNNLIEILVVHSEMACCSFFLDLDSAEGGAGTTLGCARFFLRFNHLHDQALCARMAQVTEGHPHNVEMSGLKDAHLTPTAL